MMPLADRARSKGAPNMATSDEDRRAVDLLIRGFQVSSMIRVVADLGIAGRIDPEETANVADLAAACGVLPEPLKRILRALAAFAIFRFETADTVAHTPRSLLLRPNLPVRRHQHPTIWPHRHPRQLLPQRRRLP